MFDQFFKIKLGEMTHTDLLNPSDFNISYFEKYNMADSRHLETLLSIYLV